MDESNTWKEELEVLEALYDFKETIQQTLSFKKDDLFIFHSSNNIQRNWWNVINEKGKVGYIPSNYVERKKVNRDRFLDFLNVSIENLGKEIAREGGGSEKQLETMQELISRKQELSTRKAKGKSKEKLTSSKSLPASDPESRTTPPLQHSTSETFPKKQESNVDPTSSYLIVQEVRKVTGLSHEKSRLAVGVVVEGVLELIQSSELEKLLQFLHKDTTPPPQILDQTPDADALRRTLDHLMACKDDAQQRSWQLWDDENTIKEQIIRLTSILSNADHAICVRVLKKRGFEDVNALTEYYQMEERWSIRELLLKTFTALCTLDRTVINILLNSVLAMELAREMKSNAYDTTKLSQSVVLLSMIFSLGEPMPITHIEYLGVEFLQDILSLIEREGEEEISDSALTLLLSYNLQFVPQSPVNVLVQALSQVECAKTFTEKVLLLINREDDPVANLKTSQVKFHSVLKLLKDIFGNKETSRLFYVNDTKVLVDIIVRQITDLQPNMEKRTDYLDLARLVMLNSDPLVFEHRLSDLKSRFLYIMSEEVPPVARDKSLVREIIQALPQLGELSQESE